MNIYPAFGKSRLVFKSFVLLAAVASTYASATETITIDASKLGPTVKPEMFGANFVYKVIYDLNDVDTANDQYSNIKVVRYPGGSITESEFNLYAPDQYMSGDTVPANKRLGKMLSEAYENRWTTSIVLPTKRYQYNISEGKTAVRIFVRDLLQGKYGTLDLNRTPIIFEIGNEYWGDVNSTYPALTPTNYGKLALEFARSVKFGIDAANVASTLRSKIRIAVQLGHTDTETAQISKAFLNNSSLVDLLVQHMYPRKAEHAIGLESWWGTTQPLSQRFNRSREVWRQNAGFTRPLFFSEYNIRNSTNQVDLDIGERNPLALLAMFSEAVKGNTVVATVWPFIGDSGKETRYYGRDSVAKVIFPTTNAMFAKMLRSVENSRILTSIANTGDDSSARLRNGGVYVQAFKHGSNRITVFVCGTRELAEQVQLKFTNFKFTKKISAERLVYRNTGDSVPNISTLSPVPLYPKIGGTNSNQLTLTVNSNSTYEVIKLVYEGL